MFDLKDKVVFITGGSSGIGAMVIEYLLKENVKHVINLDIDEGKGIASQNELNKKFGENKVKFIKGDVTIDADLSNTYKTILREQGYIDVVINNAGILNDSSEKYRKEIEINVTALITNTLKAIDVMSTDKGGKGGVVINISSIGALLQDPMFPVYYATKSAVLQFSNCIGLPENYANTGVRVIAVCFGATDTSLLSKEKIGKFDKEIDKEFMDTFSSHRYQKIESAAHSVIEVIKRGESGSTWLSNANLPVQDITSSIKNGYGVLAEHVVFDWIK